MEEKEVLTFLVQKGNTKSGQQVAILILLLGWIMSNGFKFRII